ncbi:hypothetical protein LTS18_005539 [Coniosporium uncinatum]|uniref:Uncharacterized protein n=1 Tax=Coniosporium uncinatum TaxID=93489 RepID=A0ACC3DRM4_9PEZI|nr:hypothetical protein LTS18_005539 [Coniosporium uncinatum]
MSFAPYQDAPPESERALSPSPDGAGPPRRSFSPKPNGPANPARVTSTRPYDPTATHGAGAASQQPLRDPSYFADNDNGAGDVEQAQGSYQQQSQQHFPGGGFRRGFGGGGRPGVDLFETRLGIRMDWEACLAYLLLPPAGGVMLLVLEHKSDYVR